MNIVITGYAGLEGSLAIFENKKCREKLLNRYGRAFFGVFENERGIYGNTEKLDLLFSSASEAGTATDSADGGVLGALWRLLKRNRLGGAYSQRSIPVLQQTIEICEMFAVNPYRLSAPGCRVWLSEDTGLIAGEAASAGVPLSIAGFTMKGAAIKRTDTEGDSSLRRPEGDLLSELLRLYG